MQNISKEDALAFHNVIFCTLRKIRMILLNCSISARLKIIQKENINSNIQMGMFSILIQEFII